MTQPFAKGLAAAALFLLQLGCSSFTEELETNVDAAIQAKADTLSFAYDFSIDTVAYMSCMGEGFHSVGKPFFSFKAGAYNEGSGLKLRSEFVQDFGGISRNRLVEYMGLSPRNKGAGVIMSVRGSGSLQAPLEYGAPEEATVDSPQVAGLLYEPAQFLDLTQAEFFSYLLDNNQRPIPYLNGFPGTKRKRFEGEIRLHQSSDAPVDKQYRTQLQDAAYLSFTFATEGLEQPGYRARSPYDPNGLESAARGSVWGKGYQFNFAQMTSLRPSSSKRVMTSVAGVDLENESSLGETWVCPPSERYYIIQSQEDALRRYDAAPPPYDTNHPQNPYDSPPTAYDDGGVNVGGYYFSFKKDADEDGVAESVRQKVICPLMPDVMPSGKTEHEDPAWVRIRQVLKPEEWYVYRGPKYNCIVPKTTSGASCYGQVKNAGIPVQYFSNEDFPDLRIERKKASQAEPIRDFDCGGPGSTSYCPHILSVCYKL